MIILQLLVKQLLIFFYNNFYEVINSFEKYFGLSINKVVINIGLGILFILLLLPLVNKSMEINQSIPLPEWASSLENNAGDIMESILGSENWIYFFLSIVLIGVVPAIGEEFLFRGIIQKELSLKINPILAVWISAILFSLIHFQFAGFLPRLILGAGLGYLYLWTKNLWVPMAIHFFNNTLQIIVLKLMPDKIDEAINNDIPQISWLAVLFSGVLMYFVYKKIRSTNIIGPTKTTIV